MNPTEQIKYCKEWLTQSVFPLWIEKGIDKTNGSFIENLSFEGEPLNQPKRAMVQTRQIYSYVEAFKMGLLPREKVSSIVEKATDYLISKYSLPSGAFFHAVNSDGSPEAKQSELYTQAFCLFGLAKAFELLKNAKYKSRAKELYSYLQRERRVSSGGYTEIKNGKIVYQSNPHMHLFEAALAWREIDPDADWIELSDELFNLCKNHFVDKKAGVICEHFDGSWNPLREEGNFIFEPGHQYEWSWLLVQYEKISKNNVQQLPEQLYALAERYGVNKAGDAIDEIWSHFEVKKSSSRFWPQCERVKAALEIGIRNPTRKTQCAMAADEALNSLRKYLNTPKRGLWYDTLLENGQFNDQVPKSSSLYHIINAMSEYSQKRLLLGTTG
jgi:mannose-6-phosphate isomerase